MNLFSRILLLFISLLMFRCASKHTAGHDHDDLYFNSTDKRAIHKEIQKKQHEQKTFAIKNPELSWTINISGTNNVHKKIVGGPNELSQLDKILKDSLSDFPKDELVQIELSFSNTNALLTEKLFVRDARQFAYHHFKTLNNCESPSFNYPNWSYPFYSSSETFAGIDKMNPAEGNGCLMMKGTGSGKDGYIISLTKYFQNKYGNNPGVDTRLNTNADNTWIFFYLYGSGDTSAVFDLLFREGSSSYSQEYYKYSIPLDFKGWKQFAVKYSDIVATNWEWKEVDEATDPHFRDPEELQGIQFTLASKIPGKPAITYIDKMMLLSNR